ncbi:MAG: HIT domain-containing protein [Candidatus Omnitrophota bacterium]
MDKLWAPWRSKYVTRVNSIKGCIFCSKPKAGNDEANYIISRGKSSLSMLNIFPYSNGHVMVAPYRHVKDMIGLSAAELFEIFDLTRKMQSLLVKTMKPDGFNIGINVGRAAGAGVKDHIHIHIVPRWVGDVNFMPVFTSTKVISESLDALYDRLTKCLRGKK